MMDEVSHIYQPTEKSKLRPADTWDIWDTIRDQKSFFHSGPGSLNVGQKEWEIMHTSIATKMAVICDTFDK